MVNVPVESSLQDNNEERMAPLTTRVARRKLIEKALASGNIHSQQQLSEILAEQGIVVTQATLSRDLDELKAVKMRGEDGQVVYRLTSTGYVSSFEHMFDNHIAHRTHSLQDYVSQEVSRILADLVTSVTFALNQVVVHTPSGAAQYVASVFDSHPLEGVLGTIAGDDTVLIIVQDENTAKEYTQWLLNVISRQLGNDSK